MDSFKTKKNKIEKIEKDNFVKKIVEIKRITKVVKGGRNMRFSALVVVGDENGMVGIASSKAREVPMAIDKAVKKAKKNMIQCPISGESIPHTTFGSHEKSKILMMPARSGNGLIAGGVARLILEAAGVKSIRTKFYGSRNKKNCAIAVFKAIKNIHLVKDVYSMHSTII